ncbi:MAG: uridine kinase [Candidatus Acidiferrales bacterium]
MKKRNTVVRRSTSSASKERTIQSPNLRPLDSRPLIIGICGGTGSGKTTITRRIIEALTETSVVVLQQDNYYRDYPELSFEDRVKVNFDHPDSMDTPLLAEDVRRLRAGHTIERPTYDFANFRRLKGTVRIEPLPAIIVEGILIFENKQLRELMDIKIFVDTDADLRFIRRLVRDIRERGRTMDMVIEQYMNTVRPMHMEFVEPSKRYADVIIPEGGYNDVGIDLVIQKIRSLVRQ